MDIERLKRKLKKARFAGGWIISKSGQKAAMEDMTEYIIELETSLSELSPEWAKFIAEDNDLMEKEIEADKKATQPNQTTQIIQPTNSSEPIKVTQGEMLVDGKKMQGVHIDLGSAPSSPDELLKKLTSIIGIMKDVRSNQPKSEYQQASEGYQAEEARAGTTQKASEEVKEKPSYPNFVYGRDATGRLRRYPTQ